MPRYRQKKERIRGLEGVFATMLGREEKAFEKGKAAGKPVWEA